MSNETQILALVETENGVEVHISEKAYENFAVIGLLERIKLDLLNKPNPALHDLRAGVKVDTNQNYDA